MRKRKMSAYEVEGKIAAKLYERARYALQALVTAEFRHRGNSYRLRASKALVELLKG